MDVARCKAKPWTAIGIRGQRVTNLILDSVNPDFGAVVGTSGDAKEVAVKALSALPEITGSACADGRRNTSVNTVVLGIDLLENADEAFAARDIDALAGGIVVSIVGVLNARKRGNGTARSCVEHGETSGLMSGHEKPVVGFI